VSLALAITSSAKVLLIEEPLAGLDPAAPARVVEALRARGAAGAAIVVTTASVREATRLGDQLGVLTRGVFTHLHPTLAHVGPAGARLRVVLAATTEAAAPFLEALSAEPGVQSVASTPFVTSEARPSAIAILVGGPDLLKLARGVSAAAARTGALVEAIESAVMPLEAIRALVVPRPATVVAAPKSAPPASMPPPSVPPPAPPGPPSASSGGPS
jgi:ABC-type multidrug transport system ATPase subunit